MFLRRVGGGGGLEVLLWKNLEWVGYEVMGIGGSHSAMQGRCYG